MWEGKLKLSEGGETRKLGKTIPIFTEPVS